VITLVEGARLYPLYIVPSLTGGATNRRHELWAVGQVGVPARQQGDSLYITDAARNGKSCTASDPNICS